MNLKGGYSIKDAAGGGCEQSSLEALKVETAVISANGLKLALGLLFCLKSSKHQESGLVQGKIKQLGQGA